MVRSSEGTSRVHFMNRFIKSKRPPKRIHTLIIYLPVTHNHIFQEQPCQNIQKSVAELPKLATKAVYQNAKLVSYRTAFSY